MTSGEGGVDEGVPRDLHGHGQQAGSRQLLVDGRGDGNALLPQIHATQPLPVLTHAWSAK